MSIIGSDGEQSIRGECDNLFGAGKTRGDERRIGGFVVLGFPENFTGGFVKRDQTCAVLTSDGDDNGVAVNDARTVVAAAAGGAFVGFAAEEFHAEIAFKA